MCQNKTAQEIELPDGWDHQYGEIDDERNTFCPGHAAIKPFTDNQCVGCVGGWTECDMWRAFAYSGRATITEDDFAALERGICPRRVNGTISFDSRSAKIEDIYLSSEEVKSGKAFAAGIRDYIKRYGKQ